MTRAAPQPAYLRIKQHVERNIRSGAWREGDAIPSEHALTERFGVARMTVNRALRELVAEKLITRIQGAGSFVARTRYESTLVAIKNIAEEIRGRGHVHSARVLELAAVRADALLAQSFDLKRGAALHHSRLLHLEDGDPIQLEQRWVNPAVAPLYMEQDFTQFTPNEYLVRVAPLERVEYDIEAAAPQADVRRVLAMQPQEPCLILRRRTWSRGQVATVAVLLHPGSRYRFAGHF